MNGNLKDMSVADLIQHNCADQKTARLTVENGSGTAHIFFEEGAVVHAEDDADEGEEVIYTILNWHSGTFSLEQGVPAPKTTISTSWAGLLLKGAQRLDESEQSQTQQAKENIMANIDASLNEIMNINGAIAAAVVDWKSGLTLGTAGSAFNIELAAAGNTNVVRAKFSVMKDLKLNGTIEDILITLTDQLHLIRHVESNPDLFIYVALSKANANLGLARHRLIQIEHDLEV